MKTNSNKARLVNNGTKIKIKYLDGTFIVKKCIDIADGYILIEVESSERAIKMPNNQLKIYVATEFENVIFESSLTSGSVGVNNIFFSDDMIGKNFALLDVNEGAFKCFETTDTELLCRQNNKVILINKKNRLFLVSGQYKMRFENALTKIKKANNAYISLINTCNRKEYILKENRD